MEKSLHPCAPLYRRLTIAVALCTLVGGVFLLLSYLFAFDADIHYFVAASPLWILARAFFAAGVFCVLAGMLVLRKKASFAAELPTGAAEVFFGYFAAVLLAICFMREVGLLTAVEEMSTLGQAAAYTSVLPPLYFLVSNLSKQNSISNAFFAFGAIIAVVLSMFRDYFDLSLPLNGSVRILTTVAQASLLLFFLSEARLHISPERATLPAFYLANGSAGLFLIGTGIAQGIFAFMDTNRTFDVLPQAAMAAVGALAFCRICRAYRCLAPYKPVEEDKPAKKSPKTTSAPEA